MAEVLAGGGLLWAKVWGVHIDHAAPAVQWVWGLGDVLGDIIHLWIVQVDCLVQMLSRASFSTPGRVCVANAWECILMAGPEGRREEVLAGASTTAQSIMHCKDQWFSPSLTVLPKGACPGRVGCG